MRRRKHKYLPGVNRVEKKLPDGTVVGNYYYAWRGKGAPLLADENGLPLQDINHPKFAIAYAAAYARKARPPSETMATLIDLFRGSSEFTTKGDKTRKSYDAYLKLIEIKFGTLPIAAVQDPGARGLFKAWRDTMTATPRKADYVWTVLARVLSVAKDRGKITVNVCEKGGRLYEADRTEEIWTADDIKKFCGVASPELQAALMLALWTGQRQGDLLKLTWGNYDGVYIKMRQGKSGRRGRGGKRVTIPVGNPLKAALDALKAMHDAALAKAATSGNSVVPATILINSRGQPWTEDGFRASWGKAFKKGCLDDLHFHDLRGTAVTRLALAGCTVPQIASITGHSLKDVEAILDAHYLGGKVELAEAAIIKLNAAYGE
jgi:integrase